LDGGETAFIQPVEADRFYHYATGLHRDKGIGEAVYAIPLPSDHRAGSLTSAAAEQLAMRATPSVLRKIVQGRIPSHPGAFKVLNCSPLSKRAKTAARGHQLYWQLDQDPNLRITHKPVVTQPAPISAIW